MRFRLSTLLLLMTLLAVSIGLGHRVHVLQQQVSALQSRIQWLQRADSPQQQRTDARFPDLQKGNRKSDVLLNNIPRLEPRTDVGVPYSVEEAMLMDGLNEATFFDRWGRNLIETNTEIVDQIEFDSGDVGTSLQSLPD